MFKYFVLVIAIFAMASLGFGQHDYNPTLTNAPANGWGHDCNTWVSSGGVGYGLTSACLRDDGTFIDCATQNPVIWPGLDIQVWVEAMCWFSWEETAFQVHVASTEDAQDICMVFNGTNSCNIPVNVNTEAPANGTLDAIPYVGGIGNWNSGDLGGNLEATWMYAIDNGPWTAYAVNAGAVRTFPVPTCHHNIHIQCCLHFDVHQKAGYYQLVGGSICPANPS